MSLDFSNLSQKQRYLSIAAAVVVVVLLVAVVSMYGNFLKTQVASPGTNSLNRGSIKADLLKDTGQYTLQFEGQGVDGKPVTAETAFEVVPK